MCKILTLSNGSKVKNPDKLVKIAADLLSDYERDGFGYVIQGDKGIFGERTLTPDRFKSGFGLSDFETPFTVSTSNTFGIKSKVNGAMLFHGRTSTNHKTLLNTHPINKRDWSLIHNGVVTNQGPDYEMLTTNDTEHVLEYLSTVGVSGIEKNLTGYYAVCALDPKGVLHIIRDSTASLYVTKVESIDSFIFATTEDLLTNLCKQMKWKMSVIKTFRANTYITLKGLDILSCKDINPRGRTTYEDNLSGLSLGRSLVPSVSSPVSSIDSFGEVTTDEDLFLHEVNNYADETYTYLTFNGENLTYDEFNVLPDREKLDCQVFRPDGTEVNPYNYENINMSWVG